jgi:Putative beta-barrel porin-2, OmpL-like. bbp2
MLKTFLLLAFFHPDTANIPLPITLSARSPLSDTLNTLNKPNTPDTPTTPHPISALLFSASADLYYRYDLARTSRNIPTSFTHPNNQFTLGMVGVKIEHKTARVDLVADLGIGPRQQEYAYNDQGIVQLIKQLYISYTASPWLKFTAGTWETHLGYEVLDAFGNRNYSMSYIFTNTVFSHTGIKADLSFGKNGFMIGVSNPGDCRSIPPGSYANKQLIAQYSFTPSDNLHLYLNYVGGRDIQDNKTHQYDLTLTNKFSHLLSIGFNSSMNTSSMAAEKYTTPRTWYGSALYLNVDPKNWLGFTLRTEYFNDRNGEHFTTPTSIFATTLSANLKIDGFTLIPEFRIDNASAPVFFHHNDSPANTTASFLIAAVYSF